MALPREFRVLSAPIKTFIGYKTHPVNKTTARVNVAVTKLHVFIAIARGLHVRILLLTYVPRTNYEVNRKYSIFANDSDPLKRVLLTATNCS